MLKGDAVKPGLLLTRRTKSVLGMPLGMRVGRMAGVFGIVIGISMLLSTVYAQPPALAQIKNTNPVRISLDDLAAELLLQRATAPPLAPVFSLPKLRGGEVNLRALRSQWVLINFWATWCGPCRHEMPALNQVHQRFAKRGLQVVAINLGEAKARVQRFVQQGGFQFTVALDSNGAVGRQWRAQQLPLTLLLDPQGRAVYRGVGARAWSSAKAMRFFTQLIKHDTAPPLKQ